MSSNAQEVRLSGLLGGHIVAANWWGGAGPNATGCIFWGFVQEVSTNTRSTRGSSWNNIQLCISDITEGSIHRNA